MNYTIIMHLPGNHSYDVEEFESLSDAVEAFVKCTHDTEYNEKNSVEWYELVNTSDGNFDVIADYEINYNDAEVMKEVEAWC